MFFDRWADIFRTVVSGVLGYAVLLLAVRISGKRTLAKLNAFDLVVTIALGSIFASILLSKDVSLAEGATAIATLAGLQFMVALGARKSAVVGKLIKSTPRVLLCQGRWNEEGMRLERIVRTEVRFAVRKSGHSDLGAVFAVVLETDGSLSVVQRDAETSAMEGVEGWPSF